MPVGLAALAACLLGFFARQAVASAWIWVRLHVFRKGIKVPARTAPYPSSRTLSMRSPPPSDPRTHPGVLHVSMNPALIQQQTTLDILQMARQQRLEAMNTQREQVLQEQQPRRPLSIPSISRRNLEQFKVLYAPQKAPGFSASV